MKNYAKIIQKELKKYALRFLRGHWSFPGPGSEKKWYGTYDGIPSGSWTRTAEKMLLNFAGSGHPIFRCTSALEREKLRSKERGKTSIHFTACDENVRLLLKMVMSVNQLSLYGAVADMIQELPEDQIAPGRPVASDQMEQEILFQPLIAEVQINDERQGNLLQDNEQRFENLREDQKLSKLCSEASLNLVEFGQFFYALPFPGKPKNQSLCREYAPLRDEERKLKKRVDRKQCTVWPCLGHESMQNNWESQR